MTNARYVYSELSAAIQARRNCAQFINGDADGVNGTMRNPEWFDRWSDYIDRLVDMLPSGSGIDCGTKLDLDASHAEKLVFTFSYHHMNENGMYCGWTEHTAIVTPGFRGINIRISGRNRNDIKDYLYETYDQALNQVVEFSIASTQK